MVVNAAVYKNGKRLADVELVELNIAPVGWAAAGIRGSEIVRYNRAGAWYLEGPQPVSAAGRRRLTVHEAATLARKWRRNGGVVFHDVPGGSMFDRLARR